MEPTFNKRPSLCHPKLMIPGPVDVSDSVIAAMATQVVPHYGTEWTALYKETTTALKSVFHTEGDVFLLVGSGTCGLDAAINSLFVPGEKVIVTMNGFFGDRIAQLARAHGLSIVEAVAEWGSPVDPNSMDGLLSADKGIAGIIAVHHETSTGVLNPIRELGGVARKHNVPLLVDGVSSLGGEELQMDEWGVDICVTASNKCLESVPGVSPVAVSANAWKVMQGKQFNAPGWYLNLRLWKQYQEEWGNWHPAPVTMATNTVIALNAALEELFKEGLDNRIKRYKETALFFRQEINLLGFDLFVSGGYASSCISSVCCLPDMDISSFISYLLEEKNIHIAGGLGQTKGVIFRVGHMGKAGSRLYTETLLKAVKDYRSNIPQ
jgi:alanine-glyoxylate transaminase / serine-glyoxylate transaminase / serine-pyruvate transaminase